MKILTEIPIAWVSGTLLDSDNKPDTGEPVSYKCEREHEKR